MNYIREYNKWLNNNKLDVQSKEVLINMNDTEKEDSFYTSISFGTAGMRGIIGVGSNRFNKYTLRKANYGYAHFLTKNNKKNISVVIARDNRLLGEEFVIECVKVLSKFNIKCYIFDDIIPTPTLSYAIRYLQADGGIVITASHNPKEYNGYKIYDNTGCQLVPELANIVVNNVNNAPDYFDIEVNDYEYCVNNGYLNKVSDEVVESYIEEVTNILINKDLDKSNFSLTFSPLHGTSGKIGCKLLDKLGYKYIKVEEQFNNDPSFPTVEYPNPEDSKALTLSLEYAKKHNCDICIATDPDADRIGVAVKDVDGTFKYLNGNEMGAIIFDYICKNTNVKDCYMIDTIVTSNLGKAIALKHNVNNLSTFTGFKFIGQQIEYLTKNNKQFIFGYEESYGYLLKGFVRDKDSIQALAIITELACYYKNHNKNLIQVLNDIYSEYGFYKEDMISLTLSGSTGKKQIENIISYFRNNTFNNINSLIVEEKIDYNEKDLIINEINLGKSDVIVFKFKNEQQVIFRPSGTEPKIKAYLSVKGNSKEEASNKLKYLKQEISNKINELL